MTLLGHVAAPLGSPVAAWSCPQQNWCPTDYCWLQATIIVAGPDAGWQRRDLVHAQTGGPSTC